jgi:hypothetical protein
VYAVLTEHINLPSASTFQHHFCELYDLKLRGRRQLGGLSSAKCGVLFTADICICASGNFMPAMIAFHRVKGNKELPTKHRQVAQRCIIPVAGCQREVHGK